MACSSRGRCRKAPTLDPKEQAHGASMVEDHPYDYRTFEGVIPKGEYGGGQVIVWDEGIYTPDEDGVTSWDDKEEGSRRMLEGIERGKLSFTLQGTSCAAPSPWSRRSTRPDSWLLIKHRTSTSPNATSCEEDRSVRSGLTIQDLKEGRLPNPATAERRAPRRRPRRRPSPTRARAAADARDAGRQGLRPPGWLWEPKLDGIRTLAFIQRRQASSCAAAAASTSRRPTRRSSSARSASRRRHDACSTARSAPWTRQGVPRFQLLQPRINLTRGADIARVEAEMPVVFFVFDLLYLDGYDLQGRAAARPQGAARSRASRPARQRPRSSATSRRTARDCRGGARELGFEGVVGKRADSRYEPGARSQLLGQGEGGPASRSSSSAATRRGEGGARAAASAPSPSATTTTAALRYAGNVGSGFNDSELRRRPQAPARTSRPTSRPSRREGRGQADAGSSRSWSPRSSSPSGRRTAACARPSSSACATTSTRSRCAARRRRSSDRGRPARRRRRRASSSTVSDRAAHRSPGRRHERHVADERPATSSRTRRRTSTSRSTANAIKLTNLDKVFWPAYEDRPPLTKRDLIRYYVEVAPWLLPHLKDRPLTLTRYPNGVDGQAVLPEALRAADPGLRRHGRRSGRASNARGRRVHHVQQPADPGLAGPDRRPRAPRLDVARRPGAGRRTAARSTFAGSEAAMDASVLNYPDYMVFDLDPYIYSGQEKARAPSPSSTSAAGRRRSRSRLASRTCSTSCASRPS